MILALADVEDVLLVLGALGRVPPLRLLLAGVRQRRLAGSVLGNEGIERSRFGAEQLSPEAGELEIEDGDLLGTGDDAGARGVIDVLMAEDVDRRQRVDERQDLTRADRQPGVAQPAPEREQVGLDSSRRRWAAALGRCRRALSSVIAL